ncbi:MAG: hypothetical protein GXP01_02360 [Alphaproteobacteria bacterium]|nr:hypothetical protein [Alphaproteobacteria bacterium]
MLRFCMKGDGGVVVTLAKSGEATPGAHLPPPVPANDNGEVEELKTVTVRRRLEKSGLEIKVKVPVTDYFGVAVATSITEEGVLSSTIELVHRDEALNYRVFSEEGNYAVVAEWQNWGKHLNLPLFIRDGRGKLIAYSQHVGGVLVGDGSNRRRLASNTNRRPRFLNRRHLGIVPGGH